MEKKPIMEESMIKGSRRSSEDGSEEDDLVFPGFRFHPTDQELVGFYLKRKVERKRFSVDIIKDIDIYKHDPWDLPSEARHVLQGAEDKEWYFFCLRGRKYRNSIRPNRVTGSGFWKATGIDKPIHDGGGAGAGAGECVGLKKSLVYYRGSAGKGTKTDWMMHEFRLPSDSSSADFQDAEIWTICRIFKRNLSYNRRFQQQKQEHGNKRSRQQSQYYYHHGYYHHQQHTHPYIGSCASSMASSFESTTTDCQPPFQLRGFQGAAPADVTATRTSATTGTSPSASAWSELTTSFVRDDGSTVTCWDELGRIMEISTDMTYM